MKPTGEFLLQAATLLLLVQGGYASTLEAIASHTYSRQGQPFTIASYSDGGFSELPSGVQISDLQDLGPRPVGSGAFFDLRLETDSAGNIVDRRMLNDRSGGTPNIYSAESSRSNGDAVGFAPGLRS